MEFGISQTLVAFGGESGKNPFAEIRRGYEQAKVNLEGNPHVETCTVEEYVEGGLRYIVLDVELKDADALADPAFAGLINQQALLADAAGEGAETPQGDMRFTRLPNGNVEFVHVVSSKGDGSGLGPSAGTSPDADDPFAGMGEAMGRAMLASMFGDRAITVTLHAPDIVTTNGELSEDRSTVVWRIPLVEMMEAGEFHRELRAEYEPPTTWTKWILPVAAVWVAVTVFVVVALRARNRRLLRPGPGPPD